MANGIVMIRTAQMIPARTYAIAIHQPHRISQIRLRISLMTRYYPLRLTRIRPYFQRGETPSGAGSDLLDRLVKGGRVAGGRGAEPADLPDVLQRGRADVLVGHCFGVRRAQGLNRTTHSGSVRVPRWPGPTAYNPPRRRRHDQGWGTRRTGTDGPRRLRDHRRHARHGTGRAG